VDQRQVVLEVGGYISKPRGELHTMWNPGLEPARMIEVITPGNGYERFYHDVADLAADGPPPREDLADLAATYGLTFDFRWIPELVEKYSLTPPAAT